MNVKILLEKPEIDKSAKIIIKPLAPLSMVSDIPGTYYKSQEVPDKYKLCGLFENIMGWHFSKNDRAKISKKIKDFNQKKLKNKDYTPTQSNSGFQPLLFDFFEVGMTYRSHGINYNDLWKRSFSRMDADVHPKGTPNLDYEVLKKKNWIKEKEEEQSKIKEKLKELKDSGDEVEINNLKGQLLPNSTSPLLAFFQVYKRNYPLYYTSPTLREYIDYSGEEIQMKLVMDSRLFNLLSDALIENSTAYLGNNEGWVEIKLEEL